jgi:hypothetical protein
MECMKDSESYTPHLEVTIQLLNRNLKRVFYLCDSKSESECEVLSHVLFVWKQQQGPNATTKKTLPT